MPTFLLTRRLSWLLILGLLGYSQRTSAQSVTQDSIQWYNTQLAEQQQPLARARTQVALAWHLTSAGETERAANLLLTAIDVFRKYRRYNDLRQAYVSLAQLFQFQHNLPKSVEYSKQALDYARLAGDSSKLCLTMHDYAMILGENRQFGPSLAYFDDAIQLANRLNDTNNLMLANLNMASILIEKGDYLQTISRAQQALPIAGRLGDRDAVFRADAIIGAALTKLNRFAEADQYYKRAEAYLPIVGSRYYDREMALTRTEWAERQGDYRAAFQYQKAYFTLDTLLANQQNKEHVAELEIRYRTRESEQEKARLQRDLTYQRWLFAGGALLLLLIVVAIYLQRIQLAQRNQLLEVQAQLARVQLQTATDQLAVFADSVVRKNAFIDQIQNELDSLKGQQSAGSQQLIEQLNQARLLTDAQWNDFRLKFEQLHPQFIDRLRQSVPNLTDTELKMACMIRLNFSTSQIAGMLGISADSATKNRYRLRKKINTEDINSYLSNT
ncbi:tetratricopeptide repeat protein [uncultured Spirosoma sp.]|uniref:tetratricopeptide repeat protein n=1 Tax=uncultured Spirosoma sp. TaxID=278208 RepID=UPI00258DB22A|nr:tetratricopeptide repeat protein [uncultured Spirosoma sp.]